MAFFEWLFGPDKKLIDIIDDKVKQEILNKFIFEPMDELLDKENISIYYCRMEELKYVTKTILELKNVKIHYLKNSVCISDESKLVFITTNSLNGPVEILDFISIRIEKIKDRIEAVKYQLKRNRNINISNIDKIRKNFNDVVLNSDCIELFLRLRPNKLVHGNPSVISDVPEAMMENIPIINKLRIYFDSNACINSVVLYSDETRSYIHPNADNGWYCLGAYKGKELNENNVLGLINSIKIMNINDCYYVPDYLKFFIK